MKTLYALLAGCLVIAGGNLLAVSQFVIGWERLAYGAGAVACISLAFFPILRLDHALKEVSDD
ncbi:hypothetical protein [Arcanobacterium phocae]|uniref:hypothetical protein n=1 Tax=Arcanobacterium phocae TaxID=131112 RepID=UPI001C0EFB98|nr:hypothetical protein [Arcanobacterium phocae]